MTLRFDSTTIATAPAVDLPALAASRAARVAPGLDGALVAHDAAEDRRRQLLDGALCVTTGQQPGLLTGPLFTLYKALTAIAVAARFEELLERPVVPVFWVAGDDHDFAEANHVDYLTLENEVERVALRHRESRAPLTPLYREPLGSEVATVMAALVAQSPNTEFRSEVVAWLERHYRPAADFATAFAESLAELLGRMGLVVLRPTSAEAKAAMAPFLVRALRSAEGIDRALAARADDLRAEGLPVPVPVGDAATLVMIEGRLGRDRLVLDGDRYVARRSEESWSLSDLEQLATDDPRRLSPNVLLRPVIEAAILPTLAYVAGPGELDYLPQCRPVYDALDVVPQTPFPRWSAFVVERRVTKVLDKYGIGMPDLQRSDLESQLVRDGMPESVTAPLSSIRTTLGQQYQQLQEAAVRIDPTLKKSVQSARNSALSDLTELEKRIVSHLKKHNDIMVQQVGKARNNLFPGGRPQERVFTIAPYLVRYGFEFLDAALDEAREYVQRTLPR